LSGTGFAVDHLRIEYRLPPTPACGEQPTRTLRRAAAGAIFSDIHFLESP